LNSTGVQRAPSGAHEQAQSPQNDAWESLSEELPPQLSPDGRFPSWAALVGMLVCPLIGLFMVGLTTWKCGRRS
jgi:hypothetical protein